MRARLRIGTALCAAVWLGIAPAHAQLVFIPDNPFARPSDPILVGSDHGSAQYGGANATISNFALATPSLRCWGDCNADGRVTIDELVLEIGIAMGQESAENCPALLGTSVSSIVTAVANLLDGCTER